MKEWKQNISSISCNEVLIIVPVRCLSDKTYSADLKSLLMNLLAVFLLTIDLLLLCQKYAIA